MSDTIRNLMMRLETLRDELEELEDVMKDLKTGHMEDLENNYKELGLTNEFKRKVALEARLDTDETYSRLWKERKSMRRLVRQLEIDVQYEQRKHQRWFVGNLIVASSLEDSEYMFEDGNSTGVKGV